MDGASGACWVQLARAKSENWIPTRDLQGLVAMVQNTHWTCSVIKAGKLLFKVPFVT